MTESSSAFNKSILKTLSSSPSGSCSHNGDTSGGYWQVVLSEPTPVSFIVIYNREDEGMERINGARVSFFN